MPLLFMWSWFYLGMYFPFKGSLPGSTTKLVKLEYWCDCEQNWTINYRSSRQVQAIICQVQGLREALKNKPTKALSEFNNITLIQIKFCVKKFWPLNLFTAWVWAYVRLFTFHPTPPPPGECLKVASDITQQHCWLFSTL